MTSPVLTFDNRVTRLLGVEIPVVQEAAIPMAGQVSGRIEGVLPVAEIMAELVEGFGAALGATADQYLRS